MTRLSVRDAKTQSETVLDSSGFSITNYVRWFDVKYGNNEDWHDWVKMHLMCGVKTHVVTSVEISRATKHDSRRTFATRLRANGVHEYDISDLLGHSRPGVTRVYASATRTVLEQAVEKLTEPWGQVIEFERRVG